MDGSAPSTARPRAHARVLVATLLLVVLPARADELRAHPIADGAFSAAAALAYVLSEAAFKDSLAPASCRWCAANGLDSGVRDALRWDDPATAKTMSNVTGFVAAPLSAFGLLALAADHDGALRQWPVDALVVFEAAIAAADLNQVTKFLVARERPYVHYGAPMAHEAEHDLSFYSGHTSLTFSLAVAAGTVASMHHYRLAPLVWAGGLTLAATTGYLRIAADQHYFTDVLTGAVLGSAIGFALPFLLHRPTAERVMVTGSGVMVRF